MIKTLIVGAVLFLVVRFVWNSNGIMPTGGPAPQCTVSNISVITTHVEWKDACRISKCITLRGAATLTNHCAIPVGVQIKINGFDKAGIPVASRDLWPASINNIPPGNYTFSIDQWLEYDSSIVNFELLPISVKVW